MIDKWKKAVDSNKVFGAILTDLWTVLQTVTSCFQNDSRLHD